MPELSEFSCLNWNYEFKPVGTQALERYRCCRSQGPWEALWLRYEHRAFVFSREGLREGPALSPADLYQLLNFSETQFLYV